VTEPEAPSSSAKPTDDGPEPGVEPAVGLADAPVAATSSRRRRSNRRLLVPLFGVLLIVGVTAAVVLPGILASKTTPTVWESITSGIQEGVVPKQAALEAFAYIYKVSIPGVTVPGGRDGGDAPTSGTGALDWVRAVWGQLTPAQQAVIDGYTTLGANDRVFKLGVTPSAVIPKITLAGSRNPAPVRAALGGAPVDIATAMQQELMADIAHIGPKLGMSVISPGSWKYPNITLTLSDKDGGNALFTTYSVNDSGNYSPCNVVAWKNLWSSETPAGDGSVSPELHVLMTHEVIHCYQNVIWNSVSVEEYIPAWIKEGTAIYLAADDTAIAEPTLPGAWQEGYFTPEIALSNRTYDAVGFFALLAHQGRALWSLARIHRASSSDGSTRWLGGDRPRLR